jgi:hypothetical protein
MLQTTLFHHRLQTLVRSSNKGNTNCQQNLNWVNKTSCMFAIGLEIYYDNLTISKLGCTLAAETWIISFVYKHLDRIFRMTKMIIYHHHHSSPRNGVQDLKWLLSYIHSARTVALCSRLISFNELMLLITNVF